MVGLWMRYVPTAKQGLSTVTGDLAKFTYKPKPSPAFTFNSKYYTKASVMSSLWVAALTHRTTSHRRVAAENLSPLETTVTIFINCIIYFEVMGGKELYGAGWRTSDNATKTSRPTLSLWAVKPLACRLFRNRNWVWVLLFCVSNNWS
jgi:hypothetical protein